MRIVGVGEGERKKGRGMVLPWFVVLLEGVKESRTGSEYVEARLVSEWCLVQLYILLLVKKGRRSNLNDIGIITIFGYGLKSIYPYNKRKISLFIKYCPGPVDTN